MNPFILVILGLFLIFIEFYVPGAVMGITGGLIILWSIIVFAMQDHSQVEVFLFIIAVFLSLGLLIRVTLKRIPKSKSRNSIYLNSDQAGYQAVSFNPSLIGKKGVVLTDLKPAGHVFIEGSQYQAISQSGYIVKGASILVIDGRGAYLVVKSI